MFPFLQKPDSRGSNKGKMKKFVAVWDNRFLENVKMCSEKIPGELWKIIIKHEFIKKKKGLFGITLKITQ